MVFGLEMVLKVRKPLVIIHSLVCSDRMVAQNKLGLKAYMPSVVLGYSKKTQIQLISQIFWKAIFAQEMGRLGHLYNVEFQYVQGRISKELTS